MGTYTEDHEPTEGKGGDENPRAIRCSVLKPVVHGSKEERVTPIHSRPSTGEQGYDPEFMSRTNRG